VNPLRHLLLLIVLASALAGCFQHRVQVAPVHVEPIHMTVDVNVKVEGEVDAVVEDPAEAGPTIEDLWSE
jgi:hypothetical protein